MGEILVLMFKNKCRYTCLLPVILISYCLILSGCDETRLESSWPNNKIIIDAKYGDWGSAQTYYNEKEKVLINLANDKEYFYICLITRNRGLEIRLMEEGFIAWFDPGANKKKTFGIRFPVGLKKQGISLDEAKKEGNDWYDQEDKTGVIDREREKWQDSEFNKQLETIEDLQDQLEIVEAASGLKGNRPGPQKMLNLEDAEKSGIEAKLGRENDYFVYELKIPLAKSVDQPYAVNARPGKPFGLGLEISGPGTNKSKGLLFNDEEAEGGPADPEMQPRGMMDSGRGFQLWAVITPAEGLPNPD